jgi:hypothetical protein
VLCSPSATDGKSGYRNDRIVAVAPESHLHRHVQTLRDVDSRLLDEIEWPVGSATASTFEVILRLIENGFFRAILPGFDEALSRRGGKANSSS